jgi:hypothetical protein
MHCAHRYKNGHAEDAAGTVPSQMADIGLLRCHQALCQSFDAQFWLLKISASAAISASKKG